MAPEVTILVPFSSPCITGSHLLPSPSSTLTGTRSNFSFPSGAWATDRTFAKGYANHIQGIALMPVTKGQGTGRETLKLTFPGPLCAVTRHVSAAGWTAIAFPSRKSDQGGAVGLPCDRLALLARSLLRLKENNRSGSRARRPAVAR